MSHEGGGPTGSALPISITELHGLLAGHPDHARPWGTSSGTISTVTTSAPSRTATLRWRRRRSSGPPSSPVRRISPRTRPRRPRRPLSSPRHQSSPPRSPSSIGTTVVPDLRKRHPRPRFLLIWNRWTAWPGMRRRVRQNRQSGVGGEVSHALLDREPASWHAPHHVHRETKRLCEPPTEWRFRLQRS